MVQFPWAAMTVIMMNNQRMMNNNHSRYYHNYDDDMTDNYEEDFEDIDDLEYENDDTVLDYTDEYEEKRVNFTPWFVAIASVVVIGLVVSIFMILN